MAFAEAEFVLGDGLFDLEGVPLISLPAGVEVGPGLETGPLRATELADSFRRARAQLQPVLRNYQVYPGAKGGIGLHRRARSSGRAC